MRRIGTDESGKGDYFGGLAVAAVYVDENTEETLKSSGVKDSKRLSSNKIHELARIIRDNCPHSIVYIGAERYNELYSKLRNANKILAWGHARAIENLLLKIDCDTVITDKFGDEKFVADALMERGKKIKLIQRTHGEEDIAVAAASILARDAFVSHLSALSKKYGMDLPKGASNVISAARDFVAKYGKDELKRVAKLHFGTTNEIVGDYNRLWAPWRMEYIRVADKTGCIFCEALKTDKYVVYRTDKSMVILNAFPYNNGHIMIAPVRHVGEFESLTDEELFDLIKLLPLSITKLKAVYNPHGFNIGVNLGRPAGAGIIDHIHIHIVPRWVGDTNFMPVIGDTKVISQSLDESCKLLRTAFGYKGK